MKDGAADRPSNSDGRAGGLWKRRIVGPLRAVLTAGMSPDRIAATVATGTVCSLCPIFGTTTLLNVGAGVWLRLNHPVLQALNQLLGPLQLVMMVAYVQFGGWIFGRDTRAFTLDDVTRTWRDASLVELVEKFGLAGLHAGLAWIMTAPVLFGLVYLPARLATRRIVARRSRAAPLTPAPGEGAAAHTP